MILLLSNRNNLLVGQEDIEKIFNLLMKNTLMKFRDILRAQADLILDLLNNPNLLCIVLANYLKLSINLT